jgi:aspartate aminotransferase-like enzyme
MKECLKIIKKEGIENVWKRTAKLAEFTRQQMKGLGLELFTKYSANTLTAVKVPDGVNGKKLVNILRDEKGVTLAGGQGEMAGKIFRIAHFGIVTENDIREATAIIKQTIEELRVATQKA